MKNRNSEEQGMVRVIAWTKEKGKFYDYVKRARLWELFNKGYIIALAD